MKKILVVLTVLCMMAGMAEAATEGDWEYYRKYDANNTAYITKYTGTSESVVIPTELGGYTVSTIGDGYNSPFKECSSLKSVVIPDGFTSIGSSAFRDCSSLTSVDIPEGVASIGSNAFYGCSNLTDIVIPDGVTSIGSEAFYNCSSLTNISIPDGVTTIGSSAFSGCGGLTSVVIPDGVTNIGNSAFRDCSKLTSIIIPDGVTSIGSQAFYNCSSLTSIVIPDGVTDIGSSTFYNCSSLTSVSIPDGVTSIGSNAFYGCSSLMSIDIPESVVSIGSGAFWYCSNLKSVIIPDGVTSIEEHLFNGCTHLTDVVIPQGVTSIGTGVFINCINLVSIDIPETVTSIGWSAFQSCKKLESIDIPPRLEELGQYAFSGCESLKSITLPDDMKSIGNGTVGVVCYCHIGSQTAQLLGIASSDNKFCDTNYPGLYFSYDYDRDEKVITGLTLKDADETIVTAQIPAEVTTIGRDAFYNCSNLINVVILNGVTSIEYDAFSGCTSLTSMIIPDSVTSIESSAFYNCKKLTEVVLPQTLASLGDNVFLGCTSLAHYTLPDDITDVGNWIHEESTTTCYCSLGSPASYALSKGNSTFTDPACDELVLRYIYDKDSANFTGLELVRAQASITEAIIPDGVTLINHMALYNLQNLTSVTIPDTVRTIESNAFLQCPQLKSITLPDHITTISHYIFESSEKKLYCSIDSDTARALSAEDDNVMFMDPQYPGYRFSYTYSGGSITGLALRKAAPYLDTAVIPDFVTDISSSAFESCTRLQCVKFPSNLKTIGWGAFKDCKALLEVSIPDGTTSIDSFAFNISGIKAYVPTSVSKIGDNAFPENARRGTIYCYQYSYAESWAKQKGTTVVLLDGKDFKSAGGTVSMPQTLYVGNGRSKTIAAEIFPKMSGLNITWKSSNTDVATVSSQGVLTAKKNGKTTVTLSVDGITARSAVTVVTPAEDFTIPADVFVEAGKATDAPAPVVYPSNAKLDLTWEVADTVIAEVSGDGKITSHVVGETTITATDSVTGLRRSATLHTIRPVTSIVLQPATLTLLPYQGAQLSAIVSADAFQFENQLVTFTSSNKKVATVDENGWVQAKGAGTAVITAVSENNIRATSQVTVSKATVLKLPSALRTIQANAFSGVAAEVVVLPAGVESIGDGAFANLSGLKLVVVPEAAAQAAKDAFAGTQAVLVRPDGREINPQ